jgi:hypothetical protein
MCVSDIIESKTIDSNVIFSSTTYFSFQKVYKVFCLIRVTEDSICRVEKCINWI